MSDLFNKNGTVSLPHHPLQRGNLSYDIKHTQLNSKQKQLFADSLEKNSNNFILARHLDEYIFASCRAVDVGDFYNTFGHGRNYEACVNANGDYFDYTEVTDMHPVKKIPRYKTFANRGFYRNHQSDRVENSIGFVFDSLINVVDKNLTIISCLIGVDKMKAPDLARTLTTFPEKQGVSMGCTIKHAICTNCQHSTEQGTRCDCLTKYLNRRHPSTRNLVAELVKGVDFFELSAVTNPAFAFSYILDVIKDWVPGKILRVAQDTPNRELFDLITIFGHIKRRLNGASYNEKLALNGKLDMVITEIGQYDVII